MTKCPECEKGADYTSAVWFVKHMEKEHDWAEQRAFLYFHTNLQVCIECHSLMPNDLYCNYCGTFPQSSSTTARKTA